MIEAVALAYFLAAVPPARVELEYVAPDGCGSREEVLGKFAAALGERAADIPAAIAWVAVESSATHYVLTYRVEIQATRAERRLEVESCDAAVEAAALLLLLSVDPSAPSSLEPAGLESSAAEKGESAPAAAPPAEPVPPAAPPPAPPPASEPPAPSRPAQRRRAPLVGFVGVRASGSSSLAPSPALGGGVELGVRLGAFSLGVDSSVEATPVPGAAAPGVELTALLVRSRGWLGLTFPFGRFRVGPYLGAGVEVLDLRASGLSSGGSGSTAFLSGALGGKALYDLGAGWALCLDLGLTVPFERPAFLVSGLEDPVHRPGVVSADAAFGLNWFFGSQ